MMRMFARKSDATCYIQAQSAGKLLKRLLEVHCLFSNPALRGVLGKRELCESTTHGLGIDAKQLANVVQPTVSQLGVFNRSIAPPVFFRQDRKNNCCIFCSMSFA